jgi:hypothetical protein
LAHIEKTNHSVWSKHGECLLEAMPESDPDIIDAFPAECTRVRMLIHPAFDFCPFHAFDDFHATVEVDKAVRPFLQLNSGFEAFVVEMGTFEPVPN